MIAYDFGILDLGFLLRFRLRVFKENHCRFSLKLLLQEWEDLKCYSN